MKAVYLQNLGIPSQTLLGSFQAFTSYIAHAQQH